MERAVARPRLSGVVVENAGVEAAIRSGITRISRVLAVATR
jgi:hypothetical protein